MTRYAIRTLFNADADRAANESARMARYMPENYGTMRVTTLDGGYAVLIMGTDVAGWTLDGYVLPRLASGMFHAREITVDEAAATRPISAA